MIAYSHLVREAVDFARVMLPNIKSPEATIQWHIQNLGIVVDRPFDSLQGLTLFRFVETPEQARNPWVTVPKARGLWVDWSANLTQGGLGRMIKTVFETLKRPEWVGFSRYKHNDRMSVYPAGFFDRLVKARL